MIEVEIGGAKICFDKEKKEIIINGSNIALKEFFNIIGISSRAAAKHQPKAKIERPEGIPEHLWEDWIAVRSSKTKAALTQTAMKRICNQAEKAGFSLFEAIEEMASRGWISFSASWVDRKKPDEKQLLMVVEDEHDFD